MIRTKHFLIMVVALLVFLMWFLIVSISIEAPTAEQKTEEVILEQPQDYYGVEYEAADTGYIKRAIFIEKVRSTLVQNPIPEKPKTEIPTFQNREPQEEAPQVITIQEEAPQEFILQEPVPQESAQQTLNETHSTGTPLPTN